MEIFKRLQEIEKDVLKATPMITEQAAAVENIYALPQTKRFGSCKNVQLLRWSLYMYWTAESMKLLEETLPELVVEYEVVASAAQEAYENVDISVLRHCLVNSFLFGKPLRSLEQPQRE